MINSPRVFSFFCFVYTDIIDCLLLFSSFCHDYLYGTAHIVNTFAFTYIVINSSEMLPNHKIDYG